MKSFFTVCVVACMFVSCQGRKNNHRQADGEIKIVKGLVVMGHEADYFIPEGSEESYWVEDVNGQMQRAYDSLTVDVVRPYTPVTVKLKVKDVGKSSEGFAADYAGVYTIEEIISAEKTH